MGDDFVTLAEAAALSGLHKNTLKRLLRQGVLRGYKMVWEGRMRWLVSVRSLRQYTDPIEGFLLDLPGPKLFLRRVEEDDDEPQGG
jgi:excisionase family DNA binding protein